MNTQEKNSILVVDDEKINLQVLNNILSPDYTVYMVKSGRSAVEMANINLPDLILLDILMPDINGFDVLESLKKSEITKNIPVIIITGLESAEDEEKGLAFGAADFICKPFSNRIIKSRVYNQIQIVNNIRKLEYYSQIQSALEIAKEKSKFFAKMSHEMRTPLNAVIGFSELTLEDDILSAEARENVEKICSAGESLLGLVNDILDISKIEERKFELVPVEYDTARMINDSVTQSIIHKQEKAIEFFINIDENIPVRLYGDDLRIKQIMNNLLSNAFKYTKDGKIELYIGLSDSPQTEGHILLTASVRDTGIGISQENVNILFSDYSRMDLLTNREIKGTGLGLSITKMMVELMGGSISVESEYGKGSIFTVKIPQKTVTNEKIKQEVIRKLQNFKYSAGKYNKKTRISRRCLPYARVLVIDDVATNLDVARGMMKPYRIEVDCLSSGQAALDAVREEKVRYNTIFMDHMMPGMDGIEAVRIIREEIGTEYAKNVPIIAFTANALTGNEEMFLNKGFNAFLTKPVDIHCLDDVINKWVRNEELEKTLIDQQIKVDGESVFDNRTGYDRRSGSGDRRKGFDRRLLAEKIEGLDVNKGLERFSGDWDIYLDIIKSFSLNTRDLLEAVREVNEENLAEYAVNVHGIKSSCRGIGSEIAGFMAESLEKASKAGAFAFVKANNPALIEVVSKLIADIDEVFKDDVFLPKEKPKIDKPYREALLKLLAACNNNNVEEIDTVMKEIDVFDYQADGRLVFWLKENVRQMNYTEIIKKLQFTLKTKV